jgi:hypothetical protein
MIRFTAKPVLVASADIFADFLCSAWGQAYPNFMAPVWPAAPGTPEQGGLNGSRLSCLRAFASPQRSFAPDAFADGTLTLAKVQDGGGVVSGLPLQAAAHAQKRRRGPFNGLITSIAIPQMTERQPRALDE